METRIFEDRRKTIRFVCEVPVLIEQRLFALGRTIQQAMEYSLLLLPCASGTASSRKRQQRVLPAVGAVRKPRTLV